MMRATVPNGNKSSRAGSSTLTSFCGTAPIREFDLWASSMSFMDFSRPMVIGKIEPGKMTAFLNASNGNVSGMAMSSVCDGISPLMTGIMLTSAPAGENISEYLSIIHLYYKSSLLHPTANLALTAAFVSRTYISQSLCQCKFDEI